MTGYRSRRFTLPDLEPPEPGTRDDDPVLVHTASSSMEAYALRARLESEDISVFVKGESEGPYRMAYTPIYLYVPRRLEVQARLVLAGVLAGELSLPDEG
jgi:hypothetical protein